MKKALAVAVALGVSLVAGSGVSNAGDSASAKTYRLSASMTPEQVITPRNLRWRVPAAVASARGSFTGTVDTRRRTLTWQISYSKIGRSPLVIADIHTGKAGRFGAILVRLCAECRSGQKGTKRLTKVATEILSSGNTWVTVITGTFPNGVVRGQIKVR